MSYLLTHLRSGWAVDQAILSEEVRLAPRELCAGRRPTDAASAEASLSTHPLLSHVSLQDRVVVLRFGHDYDETCMQMDEARRS